MLSLRRAVFATCLTLPLGSGTPTPPDVRGLYSNMTYVEEAGDVVGMEVFIVYGRGFYATVQEAEGEPDMPVVVPIKVQGQTVRFTLPDKRTFVGTVSSKGLKGHFLGESGPDRFLKRGKSYWQ